MSAAVVFHIVLTWKTCLQCLPVLQRRNEVCFAALFCVTAKQNPPINSYGNVLRPKRKRLNDLYLADVNTFLTNELTFGRYVLADHEEQLPHSSIEKYTATLMEIEISEGLFHEH